MGELTYRRRQLKEGVKYFWNVRWQSWDIKGLAGRKSFFFCLCERLRKQTGVVRREGHLFQSSHNDIPLKLLLRQLISYVACRGRQIPRHETGFCVAASCLIEKKTKNKATSACFCPVCSSYFPATVNGVKERGRSKESSSGWEQEIICLIHPSPHRKCLMGLWGTEVKGHSLLESQ